MSPLAGAVRENTPVLASVINEAQYLQHIKERCEQDFEFCVRYFFKHRKGTKFVFNEHHRVICQDLMAVYRGEIEGYICNMPPRYGKTELIVLMFTLWCFIKNPRCEFIHLSYSLPLALENSDAIRTIMKSAEFRQLWPEIKTKDSKDSKSAWATCQGGTFLAAQAGGSVTGFGAGRLDEDGIDGFVFSGAIVIDDPLKPDDARHDTKRNGVNSRWHSTIKSRRNSMRTPVICVMQRIHEQDFTQELLDDTDIKWFHRKMEALVNEDTENEHALWPQKHTREKLRLLAKTNPYVFYSQYQQKPRPRGAEFFTDWQKLEIVKAVPRMVKVVRYWDKAGTQDGGCWTAGVKIGLGVDGLYYILNVVRGQWSASKREPVIRLTAMLDKISTVVWVEQEPGSGGKESAENTVTKLAGFTVHTERPTGDKEYRAEPLAVQVAAGNVRMLEGDWNQDFIDEIQKFPQGKNKDQVDAAAGGFNKIAVNDPFGVLL